jgi:hypothetical protein
MKQIIFLCVVLSAFSCRKKFDTPPPTPANDGARLNIAQLRQRCFIDNSIWKFQNGDTNLYCIVTMDEVSGNLYKEVFIRDDDGAAMQMNLKSSGGLYTGDRIRINLNGIYLVRANNMVSLDSVDIEKSVVKISSGNQVTPKSTTLSKLLSGPLPHEAGSFQSQVVELNDVEFEVTQRGKPFANAVGRTAYEYDLTDCQGKKIPVRTSGMSNFASKLTPGGNGKLIAAVEQFNDNFTLMIRSYNELQMTNVPCISTPPTTLTGTTLLKKDFNDNNLTSGNWTMAQVTGTTAWTVSDYAQPSFYARIYNKNGTYESCETWLISPPVDLTSSNNPVLTFLTANSSTASLLSLQVSTDYNSGLPSNGTWTELSYTFPKGSFNYMNSGEIALSTFKSASTRIAFKYAGNAASGSIWDLDDIKITDKIIN